MGKIAKNLENIIFSIDEIAQKLPSRVGCRINIKIRDAQVENLKKLLEPIEKKSDRPIAIRKLEGKWIAIIHSTNKSFYGEVILGSSLDHLL